MVDVNGGDIAPGSPKDNPGTPNSSQGGETVREKSARLMEEDRKIGRNRTMVSVAAGVTLAALVGAGLFAAATSGKDAEKSTAEGAAPAGTVGAAYQVGSPDAPVTLDVYEDFQCPVCSTYEQALGPALETLVEEGAVQVNYHIMSFLGPESERAANAAGCAADEGKFVEYHKILFDNQPQEGSGGYSDETLIGYGGQAGLGSSFDKCVVSAPYLGFADATDRAALQNGIVGTPTFVLDGETLASANGAPLPPVDIYKKVVDAAEAGGAAR